MDSKFGVSVIVVAHNCCRITKCCISALKAGSVVPDEIILIDNGSTDGTESEFKKDSCVKYIRFDKNKGVVTARNAGSAAAKCGNLLFLDNDQTVAVDTIERYLKHDADMVGSEKKEADCNMIGKPYCGGDRIYLGGGGLFIERKLWVTLGGLSEDFSPAYCEDADLFWRAIGVGYTWSHCEDHGIIHIPHQTMKLQTTFNNEEAHKKSHEILMKKWDGRIPVDAIREQCVDVVDVSVLMCVYNGEKYIKQAIDSILNQTYSKFEFVIIDDGSTDGTAGIVKRYGDSRIVYKKLDKNIGLTRALNAGVRACRHEYIVRQDADDWSEPDRVEKQVGLLKANPDMALAGSFFMVYDKSGGATLKKLPPLRDHNSDLLKMKGIAVGGSSMRRSAILQIGGHDNNFYYAQDRKLSFDFIAAGYTVGAVQERLYHYRTHKDAISRARHPLQLEDGHRCDRSLDLPDVGIFVIGYNRLDMTKRCIDAIRRHTPKPYSLYLFNNGSDDGTREYFDSLESGDVRVFHSEENIGCPAARAILFQQIDNKYVMSIDNDMVVESGWLPPLVAAMESDEKIAAVVLGYHQPGCSYFSYGGAYAKEEKLTGDHIRQTAYGGSGDGDIPYFSGGGTLFRRMALNWCHDWKTDYLPTTGMDVYLAPKLLKEGRRIVGVKASRATHTVHDTPDHAEYVKKCMRGRVPLRECADRIRKDHGFNPMRSPGWSERAGARVLLFMPPPPDIKTIPVSLPPVTFPQGLGFLAANLLRHGHRPKIIDYRVENTNLKRLIENWNPDWIGCYTTSIGWERTKEFLLEVRGLSASPIVVGGPHASLFPESIPNFVDHVVCGEGEVALLRLITGKTNERIIVADRIANLDSLPFPEWSMFKDKPYARTDCQDFGLDDMAAMNTSRGCPFKCRFCSARKILKPSGGKAWTAFGADKILAEVAILKDMGYRSIYFREDNFTVNRKRAAAVAGGMRELSMEWACETRVDTMKRDDVFHFAECGCRGFYIGAESGSDHTLGLMDKGITAEQIEVFFGWCDEAGIKTYASMMFGFPGETEQDAADTEVLLQKIKPHKTSKSVFIGLPGSDMAEKLIKTGEYEHRDDCGIVYPPGYYDRALMYYLKPPPYTKPTEGMVG